MPWEGLKRAFWATFLEAQGGGPKLVQKRVTIWTPKRSILLNFLYVFLQIVKKKLKIQQKLPYGDGFRLPQTASGGLRRPQMASGGLRWPQMASDGLRWPQMASDGLRWLQMASDGFRWPQIASDGHRWPQTASGCIKLPLAASIACSPEWLP